MWRRILKKKKKAKKVARDARAAASSQIVTGTPKRPDTPMYRVNRSDPPIEVLGYHYQSAAEARLTAHPLDERIDPSKMELLPSTAEAFYGDELEKFGWKATLAPMLAGTRDEGSPLSSMREHEATIVREVYSYVFNQWADHVKLTVPAALVGRPYAMSAEIGYIQFNRGRGGYESSPRRAFAEAERAGPISSGFDNGYVAFARCGRVEFPEPTGRNVNMMPFIFGDRQSLPDNLRCYFPLIEQCPYMQDDVGKVGYLTVHESYVDVGQSQRREGLHIESPGFFSDDGDVPSFTPAVEHNWGMGIFFGPDRYDGGIFMASSVKDTSQVWNALVDSKVPGIVDRHGGCEHLRGLIGDGTKLQAGELIWMTDLTPHEALPQKESGFRQFFRVVTPAVSHWFADHSTENPKVPLPPCVTVIPGDKFS